MLETPIQDHQHLDNLFVVRCRQYVDRVEKNNSSLEQPGMPQLLESPIPHSKEFTWFPKDLPSSFAKEVCGDKTMFFHQLLSSWSVFAAMYAETVGCQLGSEPQPPRGTSAIFSD
jgi:hypothetical protein